MTNKVNVERQYVIDILICLITHANAKMQVMTSLIKIHLKGGLCRPYGAYD